MRKCAKKYQTLGKNLTAKSTLPSPPTKEKVSEEKLVKLNCIVQGILPCVGIKEGTGAPPCSYSVLLPDSNKPRAAGGHFHKFTE